MRVLVVDDAAVVRRRLAAMVREVGGAVVEAADGEEALARAGTDVFDLVVLDLNLPKTNGLTVLGKLKARPGAPRIVVVTNHATEAHRRECLARGADGFFDKSEAFERVGDVLASMASLGR